MKKRNIAASAALIFLVLIASGCVKKASPGEEKKALSVVSTIGMIADIAGEIGGERVDSVGLMGPGVDPHLYKASAGDVRRLQQADLIFYNGLHLEARMGEVLEQMESKPVFALGETLPEEDLIGDESFGGTHDPHIWFNVALWRKVSVNLAEALIETDPAGEERYRSNLAAYLEKLDALEEEVRSTLDAVGEEQRVLVTAHDAFGYFGRAYDFKVMGLQGISTASEAGARDVQVLADFIAEKKIGAIFVESSVPRKNVEALQAAVKSRGFAVAIGGELFSDAMGDVGSEEGTYIGMIRHNARTIAAALGGAE